MERLRIDGREVDEIDLKEERKSTHTARERERRKKIGESE